jgi:hypothetical protein
LPKKATKGHQVPILIIYLGMISIIEVYGFHQKLVTDKNMPEK